VQLQKDEVVKDKTDAEPELPATVNTADIVTDDVNTTADKKAAITANADSVDKAKPETEKNVTVEKKQTRSYGYKEK